MGRDLSNFSKLPFNLRLLLMLDKDTKPEKLFDYTSACRLKAV